LPEIYTQRPDPTWYATAGKNVKAHEQIPGILGDKWKLQP